jgi:hypothetical protein
MGLSSPEYRMHRPLAATLATWIAVTTASAASPVTIPGLRGSAPTLKAEFRGVRPAA